MIIRVFLLASILVGVAWLLRTRPGGSRLAITRLAGFVLAAGAAASVVAPGLVTDAAHLVGVREGPNLILYVLVVVFVFTTIVQGMRMRELERRLAQLARAQALAGAAAAADEQQRV
ncbi:DUF2304 family protein [Pimelobacter simplex]|uniref:Putative conserved membrane protein n=1 Tax=Nocardioides simplex TaxID=2045 RepID=A0A0C5XAP3_NOCSI|nr:DUF2304 family protein [Pimelobacter simplex]AJR18345.1 putative conserved membrane protein [Pimelobacter simplex]MCG8151695.1 DUF2304 family protein [Pimelobacter simplex]GEB13126.1 hypothetical protein NSI01_14410 [Pimelobacter simplex]SFM49107.1 hypothetical protein SAMN05421671_1906 [Pimelobacter simplex]